MNIFVYSDESGVLDKQHNRFFVFGGLLFLSKEEKDTANRKYLHSERTIRGIGSYGTGTELKAAKITPKEKGKLYRSLNAYYKFGVVIDQQRIRDSIMVNKKSKQRYLDYAFKIGVKRLLQKMIGDKVINPKDVENIYFFVDEHTTATNGIYELQESLEEELKYGTHNWNFSTFYPPLFPKMQSVQLRYCNSSTVTLIRAADILANRIYFQAANGKEFQVYDGSSNRLLITNLP